MESTRSLVLCLAWLASCSAPAPGDAKRAAAPQSTAPTVTMEPTSTKTSSPHTGSLRATLTPHKRQLIVGEPLHITYTLFNDSEADIQFVEGGNQRNRLGRFDDYDVRVFRSDGTALETISSEPNFGGISFSPQVASGQSFTHELFLPWWVAMPGAGTYTVRSERTFTTRQAAEERWHGETGERISLLAETQITIIAANDNALGEAIAALGREMFSPTESATRTQAWQSMGAIADPRVIPYYRRAMESMQYEMVSSALTALLAFDDDSALATIKMATKLDGTKLVGEFTRPELAESSANNLRVHAAQTLSASPHKGAMPLLLTMAKDTNPGVRLTVLHALASKRPTDAKRQIAAFTRDDSKMVRDEAKRYLAEFWYSRRRRGLSASSIASATSRAPMGASDVPPIEQPPDPLLSGQQTLCAPASMHSNPSLHCSSLVQRLVQVPSFSAFAHRLESHCSSAEHSNPSPPGVKGAATQLPSAAQTSESSHSESFVHTVQSSSAGSSPLPQSSLQAPSTWHCSSGAWV